MRQPSLARMIRIATEGAVWRLLLDRPEQRNALSDAMIDALATQISAAERDPDCRCVVIASAGDHFCAGRELATGRARDLPATLAYDDAYAVIFERLRALTKPSVAVVRGYAVAGGFTLAMACDFVLAEAGAKFGAVEMKNGFPASINTAVLAHLLGPRRALELLLLGDIVTANDLYEMGLINRIATGAAKLATLEADFTAKLVALDPIAVRLTKETHRAAGNMPLADALTLGKHLNALLLASGRIDEASAAYARRRGR